MISPLRHGVSFEHRGCLARDTRFLPVTGEFELIRRYFSRPTDHTVRAGGDDAALLSVGAGMQLVVCTDMLVEGRHFLASVDAADLGWKAMAVNLSDLAAMGACPRWALLALSLPQVDAQWLGAMSAGLYCCADAYGVDVIGGDTTRGPLSLCVTACGEVPSGQAVTRDGACPGDDLWISGTPGRAALGLAQLQGRLQLPEPQRSACLAALHRPRPRLEMGMALRGIASAMLDVSDGLLGDLGHILAQSGVGAELEEALLPLDALAYPGACRDDLLESLLHGGDDYELLFCAPQKWRETVVTLGCRFSLPLFRIGKMSAHSGQVLCWREGQPIELAAKGYDHFA